MSYRNHYEYLDANFFQFAEKIGADVSWCAGIISAHGDKCRQYFRRWEEAGIEPYHGAMMYLISYLRPFSVETENRYDMANWCAEMAKKHSELLSQYPVEVS